MTDEDDTTEYTTDRGVTLYVFRGISGRRNATLRGDDGQRIELEFADVPRLIQTLQWAMDDVRKADEERQAARTRGA